MKYVNGERVLEHNVDYGFMLLKSLFEAIICKIPLINLLYTRKVKIDATIYVTCEDGHTAPSHGTFVYTRIPIWKKRFRVIFASEIGGAYARVFMNYANYKKAYVIRENWENKDIQPLKWYVSDFIICGVNKR